MRNFATLSKTLTNSPSRIIRNGSFRRVIRENNQITNTPPVYSYKENNNSSIIKVHDPVATTILNEPTIIIERQIEFMNVFLGFEQANRYAIMDVNGNKIASMMERDFSITTVSYTHLDVYKRQGLKQQLLTTFQRISEARARTSTIRF